MGRALCLGNVSGGGVKFYMDAMTGKFYADDSQVIKLRARKLYGPENEVEITISNQN